MSGANRSGEVLAHLCDGVVSLVVVGDGGMPVIAHWGAALGSIGGPLAPVEPALFERPVVNGGLDLDPPVGWVTEAATGWFGRPGLEGHHPGGLDFQTRFRLVVAEVSTTACRFELVDDVAALRLVLSAALEQPGGLRLDAVLSNEGASSFALDALRVTLPVGSSAQEVLTLGGRHCNEFLPHRTEWVGNCITLENRHGKNSHERVPAVWAGTPGFGEESGTVWSLHLAWSGNTEIVCDAVSEARRVVQVGELLLSGEVELAPGESYAMPSVYAAWSSGGLNGVSRVYHGILRARDTHPTTTRPVLLNTWEAVYFRHDLDRLRALATLAAECGIERFVLDDGWFHLRRDDRAGLGDWWVDPAAWPTGLTPLVEHVRGLGMEMGIWVEPEMVNPDSDLFRAHPEWALVDRTRPLVLGRHQLVLDVGRPEVRDLLFERLDALLREHDIQYVKWDHNRDLVSPASSGRAGVRRQTLGAYELFDRLRDAHPGVEFETCASGGGRVDFEILRRTVRAWTSDSIDALDRHRIQRGFSYLFPPEIMGAHVGSTVCHSTDRRHSASFRAAAALFGHLGIEWNLLDATDDERAVVAAVVALHKEHRALLHAGDVVRVDHADPSVEVHGVVSRDRAEALFAVTRLSTSDTHHTAPVRIPGLDPEAVYDVAVISLDDTRYGPARRQPEWLPCGLTATGRQLDVIGLGAPVLMPEFTMLLRVTARHSRTAGD